MTYVSDVYMTGDITWQPPDREEVPNLIAVLIARIETLEELLPEPPPEPPPE